MFSLSVQLFMLFILCLEPAGNLPGWLSEASKACVVSLFLLSYNVGCAPYACNRDFPACSSEALKESGLTR